MNNGGRGDLPVDPSPTNAFEDAEIARDEAAAVERVDPPRSVITMTCNFCGGGVTGSHAEVVAWDAKHFTECEGAKPEEPTADDGQHYEATVIDDTGREGQK